MRVLVTGANGFVGQAFCKEAIARGINTIAATRRYCEILPNIKCFVVGDIHGETDWSKALKERDVVIHLAARVHVMLDSADDPLTEFRKVNTVGTEQLARSAAATGVKRFVYVSSVKVNGEETIGNQSYSENSLPNPQDPYGISKWEAEQALQRVAEETGLEIVIVRTPLVYGADVKGNFVQLISVLKRGLPLPFASVSNKRSLLYVDNLVDALLLCATHPEAAGQTYLVSDGEDLSTPDLLHKLSIAMGQTPRLFPFPISLLRLAGYLMGKSKQIGRLLGSLQIDSSKIRRELGWEPPYSLKQGLQNTVQKVNQK